MLTIIHIFKLSFLLVPCWSFSTYAGYGEYNRSITKRQMDDGETCERSLNPLDLVNDAVDACIEAHEECEEFIEGGMEVLHVHNPGNFRISKCACDIALKECLTTHPEMSFKFVKALFFDLLAPPCFDQLADWAAKKLKNKQTFSLHDFQSAAHSLWQTLYDAVKGIAQDVGHAAHSFEKMLQ